MVLAVGAIWLLVLAVGAVLAGMAVSQAGYRVREGAVAPVMPETQTAMWLALGGSGAFPTAAPTATATPFPMTYTLITSVPPEVSPPPTLTPTTLPFYEGPMVIGYSVGGRPIEVHRFGDGSRAYMIVAGIHGGYEVNTIRLADEIIAYFLTYPEEIPLDARLYILRAFNPDGASLPYDADGRANLHGVDLNRNFPVEWAAQWDRQGCWDYRVTHGGTGPASEPETQAFMRFVVGHPLIALVSFHAMAPGFYPAGDPVDPASDRLSMYLSKASGYPYPSIDLGCYMTGSLPDWVMTMGAAAVDVELTDHYGTDFEINVKLVKALLGWLP